MCAADERPVKKLRLVMRRSQVRRRLRGAHLARGKVISARQIFRQPRESLEYLKAENAIPGHDHSCHITQQRMCVISKKDMSFVQALQAQLYVTVAEDDTKAPGSRYVS